MLQTLIIVIPIIRIRQSHNHIIFVMGTLYLERPSWNWPRILHWSGQWFPGGMVGVVRYSGYHSCSEVWGLLASKIEWLPPGKTARVYWPQKWVGGWLGLLECQTRLHKHHRWYIMKPTLNNARASVTCVRFPPNGGTLDIALCTLAISELSDMSDDIGMINPLCFTTK